MNRSNASQKQRPRELRRRVVLPARLRSGATWSDICILNISSRGLMVQSARLGSEGSKVELYRGSHVIIARVVWREGARAGLRSEDRVPIEEILCVDDSPSTRLTAEGQPVERRRAIRRPAADSRLKGRAMVFIAVSMIAMCLAGGAWVLVETAFARPMAMVNSALAARS
jgi:hypothetical protein